MAAKHHTHTHSLTWNTMIKKVEFSHSIFILANQIHFESIRCFFFFFFSSVHSHYFFLSLSLKYCWTSSSSSVFVAFVVVLDCLLLIRGRFIHQKFVYTYVCLRVSVRAFKCILKSECSGMWERARNEERNIECKPIQVVRKKCEFRWSNFESKFFTHTSHKCTTTQDEILPKK